MIVKFIPANYLNELCFILFMAFYINYVSDSFIDKIYEEASKQLNDFFDFKWEAKKPKIYVVPDRKTINMLLGEETKSWVVGWSDKKDIFILDRNNYEKESSESYKEIYYKGLITHELVHSYFNEITKDHYEPMWVSEGIARYLAGETNYKEKPKQFSKFLKFFKSSVDSDVYYESGHAVKLLVEKYGRKKFIGLVKKFPDITSESVFNNLFEKIYGFELNYMNFNRLLS